MGLCCWPSVYGCCCCSARWRGKAGVGGGVPRSVEAVVGEIILWTLNPVSIQLRPGRPSLSFAKQWVWEAPAQCPQATVPSKGRLSKSASCVAQTHGLTPQLLLVVSVGVRDWKERRERLKQASESPHSTCARGLHARGSLSSSWREGVELHLAREIVPRATEYSLEITLL